MEKMDYLEEVLPFQAHNLNIGIFKDELTTMRHIFEMPKNIRNLSVQWLEHMHKQETLQTQISDIKSQELREKGNEAYKLKRLLMAAAHYTKAIFVASSHGEQLCLAYGNRAQVLLEYGYFAQAHDDCVCALENGYPKKLQHKILLRQANCAWKMLRPQLLQQHLNQLKQLKPNAYCTAEIERLQKELLKLLKTQNQTQEEHTPILNFTLVEKTANNDRGRCLVAQVDLVENSLLFEETAYSLVAAGDESKCCSECLSTLFIPFPCSNCYSQVVYCSLACKDKDAKKHAYECVGYRMGYLYDNVGIGHLALRTLLIGLPEVLSELHCQQSDDADSLWQNLNNISTTAPHLAYGKTLNLTSNLSTKGLMDIKYYALVADLLMQYLRDYTSFLKDMKATSVKWQLLISAILLRHIGQFITNAHKVIGLTSNTISIEGNLLRYDIWSCKFHLKRGYLNEFSCIGVVAAANFPHLSMANHACSPSFQTAFNRKSVRTYALKKLKKSEEIFNSYTLDYRASSKAERQAALKEYNFLCKCSKCLCSKPDTEYEMRYRYRCEYCTEIFVPHNNCLSILFNPVDDLDKLPSVNQESSVFCSICGKKQELAWYWEFLKLLNSLPTTNEDKRKYLLEYYFKLENWLPGYNNLRRQLGAMLVENCFKVIHMGISFNNEEYVLLANIVVNYLQIVELSYGNFSIEYARQMTFLWDLVALGKYSCTKEYMDSMLHTCTLLPEELKKVFHNYYEDYMENLIKST